MWVSTRSPVDVAERARNSAAVVINRLEVTSTSFEHRNKVSRASSNVVDPRRRKDRSRCTLIVFTLRRRYISKVSPRLECWSLLLESSIWPAYVRARTSDLCVVAVNLWVRGRTKLWEGGSSLRVPRKQQKREEKSKSHRLHRGERSGRLVCAPMLPAFPLTPWLTGCLAGWLADWMYRGIRV